MITFYTKKHELRDAETELFGGKLVKPHERPSRAQYIIERVREVSLGDIREPSDFGLDPIFAVHDADFITFLQSVWEEWDALGYGSEAIPTTWPARRMAQVVPNFSEGKLGYYAMAAETSITKDTWEAAYWSAQVALAGAAHLKDGNMSAFALCRPPGHHAAIDMFGGYCFVNNAAVAAQFLRDNGADRVVVLDIDFHHGNGTQDIFYERGDVLFISLHGDPMEAFPHFLGHANEQGEGKGKGYNINYPMQPGTSFSEWRSALNKALGQIQDFDPQQLVVSLGVDTFEKDPISFFKLQSADFTTIGADLAQLNLPTLFVMEGGYDIGDIGINTVNVLQGFDGQSKKVAHPIAPCTKKLFC